MLDDLRPVLADIADSLAARYCEAGECATEAALQRGAETLRWVHDQETTARGDELVELEHLRELVEGIEEWLNATTAKGNPIPPGTFRKEVEKLVRGAA